jgi:hypothetical protein
MKIDLTKEQFLALLKTIYLGNWMANAQKDGSPEEPYNEEIEGIENYIFSLAPQFGLEKYVSHRKSDNDKFYPSWDFEEFGMYEITKEYEETSFWEDLVERLGDRDFHNKYSKKDFDSMKEDERYQKLQECYDIYQNEFEKYGTDRLEINKIRK